MKPSPQTIMSLPSRPIVVTARTSDPETSHEAAGATGRDQSKAQRSVQTVVSILKLYGSLTDFEIRDAWTVVWGRDPWSFTLPSKARHWARQAGLVKHVGYSMHEGRRVRTWGLGKEWAVDWSKVKTETRCPHCGSIQRNKFKETS